jgi:hypothetical protein
LGPVPDFRPLALRIRACSATGAWLALSAQRALVK